MDHGLYNYVFFSIFFCCSRLLSLCCLLSAVIGELKTTKICIYRLVAEAGESWRVGRWDVVGREVV